MKFKILGSILYIILLYNTISAKTSKKHHAQAQNDAIKLFKSIRREASVHQATDFFMMIYFNTTKSELKKIKKKSLSTKPLSKRYEEVIFLKAKITEFLEVMYKKKALKKNILRKIIRDNEIHEFLDAQEALHNYNQENYNEEIPHYDTDLNDNHDNTDDNISTSDRPEDYKDDIEDVLTSEL